MNNYVPPPQAVQCNIVTPRTPNPMQQQPRMMSGVSHSRTEMRPLATQSQSFMASRVSGSSSSLRPPLHSSTSLLNGVSSQQRFQVSSRQSTMHPSVPGMHYMKPPVTPERLPTSPRLTTSMTPQPERFSAQRLNVGASSASIGTPLHSPRRPTMPINMPSSMIVGAHHPARQDVRHHGHAAKQYARHDVKQGVKYEVKQEGGHVQYVRPACAPNESLRVGLDGRHAAVSPKPCDMRAAVKPSASLRVAVDGGHGVTPSKLPNATAGGRPHESPRVAVNGGCGVMSPRPSGAEVDGCHGVMSPKPSSQLLDRSRLVVNLGNNTNRRLTDVYEINSKDVLGEGTYGSVCRGINKASKAERAIKTTSKKDVKNWERFQVEIDIMRSLDHPNIVKLYETLEDEKNTYLVMEICSGGELFDRIVEEGTFTERMAAGIMKQIFSAVGYLHSRKIAHRDLKPENFLFASRESTSDLKIIDFGLATRYTDGVRLKTKAGTPYYVAPEVLKGSYTHKCDVWSCGVIMYVMLCGYPPFFGDTDAEILNKVKKKDFDFPAEDWSCVTKDAKCLIVEMLHRDEDKRLEFADALQHIWIKESAPGASSQPLNSAVVNKFRSWRQTNRMKKIALTAIAQQLPQKEIKDMKDTFVMLDENGDGMLTLEEIRTGALAHKVQLPDDFENVFNELDSDGSGAIDYTEFIAATLNKKTYLKENVCRAAFSIFDLDGDGKITRAELRTVLGNSDVMADLGEQFGSFSLEDMINEVDVNGDGEIDFEEFMQMMSEGV